MKSVKSMKILEVTAQVLVNAVPEFDVERSFCQGEIDGVRIAWVHDCFKQNAYGVREKDVPAAVVRVCELRKGNEATFPAAFADSGSSVVPYAMIWEMLKAQGRGQQGPLLVHDFPDWALVRTLSGQALRMSFVWYPYDTGWTISCCSLEEGNRFNGRLVTL